MCNQHLSRKKQSVIDMKSIQKMLQNTTSYIVFD